MLETSDIEIVDSVSPVVAAILDRFCSLSPSFKTFLFRRNVEIERNISFHNEVKDWTDEEVLHPQHLVKELKQFAKQTFTKYRAPKLCTTKFHSSEHLSDNLMEMGSFQTFSSSAYECSHKNFKEGYNLTTKRTRLAMNETLEYFYEVEEDFWPKLDGNKSNKRKRNPRQNLSILTDLSVIVTHGKTSLNFIWKTFFESSIEKNELQCPEE